MYLFFDTETTGFPKNWKAPITDTDNWPRLVQIAWMLYDLDGNEIDKQDYIIYPEGFRIPKGATMVHGISTAQALAEGKPLDEALTHFAKDVERATLIIAHNIEFDERVTGCEFIRADIDHKLFHKPRLCTMKSKPVINFCKIRGRYGYKWPKLIELHQAVFGVGFDEEHNAAADIEATAKCFWELKRLGVL